MEREIADGARQNGQEEKGDGKGERVYLKATGRAIPRALELGVHFQREDDCWVRVDMGNVKAIDDIEIKNETVEGKLGDGDKAAEGGAEKQDDIPETRIRMLSSITVSIGLK